MSLFFDSRIAWPSKAAVTPDQMEEAMAYLTGMMYANTKVKAEGSRFEALEGSTHFWRGFCDGSHAISQKSSYGIGEREFVPAWEINTQPFVLRAFIDFLRDQEIQDPLSLPDWAAPITPEEFKYLEIAAAQGYMRAKADLAQRIIILVYGSSYGCCLPEMDELARFALAWISLRKRKEEKAP